MNRQVSRYLDLLRIMAALLVLVAHLADPLITGGAIKVPEQIGYSAVMIFFVLSGYVITYVATEREATLVEFSISRIARVYSVVIPAIAVTICVDLLLLYVTPSAHASEFVASIPLYQYASLPKYVVMDMLFANQIWGLHETLFSNGAYWSMCFEVYYYALFAAAFYFRGVPRIVLLALVVLATGPWMLFRFPLWLFGSAVYWMHRRYHLPKGVARCLFAATAALVIVDLATDLNLRIDDFLDSFTQGWVSHSFLRRFAGDTLTGLAVALNVLAVRDSAFDFGRAGAWFTYLASFSFTLYLMHAPLLRFWSAYWQPGPLVLLVLVLGSAWAIGHVTEKQKDNIRDLLRALSARYQLARSPGR